MYIYIHLHLYIFSIVEKVAKTDAGAIKQEQKELLCSSTSAVFGMYQYCKIVKSPSLKYLSKYLPYPPTT